MHQSVTVDICAYVSVTTLTAMYHTVGMFGSKKFGKFGEYVYVINDSPNHGQTKTFQISSYN